MRFHLHILALLLMFGIERSNDQTDPLGQLIPIEPGEYSAEFIIKRIEQKGVVISYSQSALKKEKVEIIDLENSVKSLLPELFDLDKYDYLVRPNKILITPRKRID